MVEIHTEVKGLTQLRDALLGFPKEINQKIQQSALLAGARLIRDKARDLAPVLKAPSKYRLAGVLKKNIRMARSKPRPGMTATVVIGVRKLSKSTVRKVQKAAREQGKKIKGADIIGNPFYWRFMEFGYTDRGGTFHGPHGGKGFLRPAMEGNKNEAIRLTVEATADQIERVARRVLSKAGIRVSRGSQGGTNRFTRV